VTWTRRRQGPAGPYGSREEARRAADAAGVPNLDALYGACEAAGGELGA
jgi:hypothetical protein